MLVKVCAAWCLRLGNSLQVQLTALKWLSPDTAPPVPWYRVVSSAGVISSRGPGTTGAQLQKDELEAEGVEVTTGRTGDLRVNFAVCGWFPQVGSIDLPQIAAGSDEEVNEGEEDAE